MHKNILIYLIKHWKCILSLVLKKKKKKKNQRRRTDIAKKEPPFLVLRVHLTRIVLTVLHAANLWKLNSLIIFLLIRGKI